MRRTRSVGVALAALAAVLSAAAPAVAQQQVDSAAFVILHGTDTLAVERFTRSATRLEAELTDRIQNYRQTYTADLTPDAAVTRLELVVREAAASPASTPLQSVVLTFAGDSAVAVIGTGGDAKTQRVATARGAVPFVNLAFALTEQMLRRARAPAVGDTAVRVFVIANGQTVPLQLQRLAGDSLIITLGTTQLRVRSDAQGRLLGAAIPAQNILVERTSRLSARAGAPVLPDYSAPAGAPYSAEEVRVPAKAGHVLAGTLTLPKNARGRVPAVVTITGSGPQDRDESLPSLLPGYALFRQVADTLARRGIAVLRLDDRGIGASGGDYRSATTRDFADDVQAALDFLRTRREIDPGRLALVGHSEGASVAPMLVQRDSAVRALVLMAAPARTGREIMQYQMRYSVQNDPSVPVEKRDSAAALAFERVEASAATVPWVRFFLDYDPSATARSVRTPVLLLQGGRDWQVQPEQAEALARAFREGGNRDVTVRVFDELNHLFLVDPSGNPASYATLESTAVSPEVLGALADWLSARLAR